MTVSGGCLKNHSWQSALMRISWQKQRRREFIDLKSVVAECPHEELAEAEEEGFSNYRVVNRHFQLNTQASTSPNMPPKAYETPAELAQAAREYGGDSWREQMSYISQTGSAGQKACLREEGLSTSNINKAFLDAAKDILKNN
ncbi:hypothetical protein PROFUN_16389 [Planoprotostelium fungivorum]|uniref:Uncharacterized protein n=1 Tax=Planoprotostelium fungivorum TaxID=1890364 RepID=A0A2P6MNM4_9EUKA|nr:hypothetical protein PROFUN_16389 [Planoprotostelium fungivorum]